MYNNIISIGFNCAIAASLRRYGLRNRTYPFDWGVSTMEGVLTAVKEKFADFLDESWIMEIEDGMYYHNKYQFNFVHDFQDGIWNEIDFEGQLRYVKNKYKKKICNFLEDMELGGILFVRQIQDLFEAKYIVENMEYINEILQIGLNNNSVIWIGEKSVAMYFKERKIPIFEAEIKWEDGRTGFLFDRNTELKHNLMLGQIDSDQQIKNLLYVQRIQDWKEKKSDIEISIRDKIFRILCDDQKERMLRDRLQQSKFVIYGFNNLGMAFGGVLRNIGLYPMYYLDKYKKKIGSYIDNSEVISLHRAAEYEVPDIIFMAIPYEGPSLDEIISRLKKIFPQSKIESIGGFLDEILNR